MFIRSVVPVVLLAAAAGTAAMPVSVAIPAATIHGTITLEDRGQRRTANRYASPTAGASPVVQPIAPVVYLRGPGLAAAAPPRAIEAIAQQDTMFQPNVALVTVGGSVDFPNRDPFFHNVFSYAKARRFDLGRFPRPESKRVDFPEPGIVNVFCEIHKSMRAVIVVVEDSRYAAVVGDDGRYEIPNIPAGSWELVVWHVDRGEKTLRVRVPESGRVRVDAEL